MRNKTLFLTAIALIAILIILFVKPIPQNLVYHEFADERTIFGINNALNVLSNIPFLLVGLFGIGFTGLLIKQNRGEYVLINYLVFFTGIFLVSIGSSYYHLAPSNYTLLWDRLPMTIAFMAFFCLVVSESVELRAGLILLIPLLIIGMGSVLYWYWSENQGIGDLRLYGLVQFLSVILVPLILFMFKGPRNYLRNIITSLVFYGMSKIFEFLDGEVYDLGRIISGHACKHVFAALGTFFILRILYIRMFFKNQ